MKIRIIEDIHLTDASYIKDQILNSKNTYKEQKHYENLYNLLIKAGYAEEVTLKRLKRLKITLNLIIIK